MVMEVEQVVLTVWASLDYICAERLTPDAGGDAQHLAGFGVLPLSAEVEAQLGQISEATVTRLLARHRTERLRLPRKGPERANQRDARRADDAHPLGDAGAGALRGGSGTSWRGRRTVGEYVHTLQLVDVATGWSERVAAA